MPIDPKKLATYMSTVETRPGRMAMTKMSLGSDSHVTADATAQLDRLEHGAATSEEQMERLLSESVGYMELVEVAKGFACGACVSYDPEAAACGNPKVKAPVSARHGCCNMFWPSHGEPSFPAK